ncbi:MULTISPECIES: DUF2860 domain-containing protein [Vibrio]|jgi:hypothetical protein|uniref:DUF2860 domain-containing protein n=1 Tax=Vibrio jasicida TaxID=766224 RepID=A0AAU9QWV4_9VIBR|nr:MULTISPECIES: DUF2860 domain-containing protein [Vibrio]CAH1599610.1 conserved exported hypothetical protein [Vibrio jasicida]CAH1602258.1 conserved exported hypothetical protein [Vibrio jasicida]
MNPRLTLLPLAFIVSTAQAQLAETAGFSGEVSLNAGFVSSESHFNTDNSSTINSLNESAESDSSFIAAPLGNAAYTFGHRLNHQVYAGTTRSDIAIGTLAFQLGYKYQLDSGTVLDFSYLPTILEGETWQNPYLTNQTRKTTDEGGNAFRFQINRFLDDNFNLDLAYADKDVEKDTVTDPSLARDAKIYHIKGDYRIPLSRTSMLQPAFTYIYHDADGDAESFNSYGLDLSWFQFINRHRVALTAGYTVKDFESASATFGKTRNDDKLSLFAAYEYKNVFDWDNWSFISLAGYSSTDSNITFYDEKEYLLSVGLNYTF